MLTTHSKQKANEASSCPSSDAHTSPHVPVPGDHRISRRVRRRIAALQGQNVKCLTAPGRKGTRQSHRPLPAARARGAGRTLTWAGGLRVGTRPMRERAPQSPGAASARRGEGGWPRVREPTLRPGPASVSAIVLRSPLSRHARTPRPSALLRRLCAAAHPRLRRATRRLCRVSGGGGGGDARSHVSLSLGPQGARSARSPGVAREPLTNLPCPLTVASSPATPRAPSPLTSSRAAAVATATALSARRRGCICLHRAGGAGRGTACTSGTREFDPARERRPDPGPRDLPGDGAPELGGWGWAEDELGCGAKDRSIPIGVAKNEGDPLRSCRQVCF